MNDLEYDKIVKKHMPKPNKLKNAFWAFISGGLIGVFSEVFCLFIKISFGLDKVTANIWTGIFIVFIASLLTSFTIFDDLVSKFKAGLIIPATGFAHAVTSSMLDYKKDGLITGIGANFFKLAGSVILYGMVSAFIMAIVWVIIYG